VLLHFTRAELGEAVWDPTTDGFALQSTHTVQVSTCDSSNLSWALSTSLHFTAAGSPSSVGCARCTAPSSTLL